MLTNNYLAVLVFQLKLHIKCTHEKDYLVVDDSYHKQIQRCIEIIKETNPDIVVFPEMSATKEYADTMLELSKTGKLIVFGSIYAGTTNYTGGKYVADGVYDPNYVDKQLGVALMLKALMS